VSLPPPPCFSPHLPFSDPPGHDGPFLLNTGVETPARLRHPFDKPLALRPLFSILYLGPRRPYFRTPPLCFCFQERLSRSGRPPPPSPPFEERGISSHARPTLGRRFEESRSWFFPQKIMTGSGVPFPFSERPLPHPPPGFLTAHLSPLRHIRGPISFRSSF